MPQHITREWTGKQIPQYKSPYGPKYAKQFHMFDMTGRQWMGVGLKAGAFGAVALGTVIFYASGVPRVQRDVLQKIPYFGQYFRHEIAPEDNPF